MRKPISILAVGVVTAMLFTGCMNSNSEEKITTTVTTTETAPTQMTTAATTKESEKTVETGDLDGDGIRENITPEDDLERDIKHKKTEIDLDMIPD